MLEKHCLKQLVQHIINSRQAAILHYYPDLKGNRRGNTGVDFLSGGLSSCLFKDMRNCEQRGDGIGVVKMRQKSCERFSQIAINRVCKADLQRKHV